MNAAKKAITKMPLRTLRSGDRVSLTQYGSFGQLGGFKDRKLFKKKRLQFTLLTRMKNLLFNY